MDIAILEKAGRKVRLSLFKSRVYGDDWQKTAMKGI